MSNVVIGIGCDHLRADAIFAVNKERDRQVAKWGDQSGNSRFEWSCILGEEYGELCEALYESCSSRALRPERGGRDNIIKEASHVAAVAMAMAIIEAELKWSDAE